MRVGKWDYFFVFKYNLTFKHDSHDDTTLLTMSTYFFHSVSLILQLGSVQFGSLKAKETSSGFGRMN